MANTFRDLRIALRSLANEGIIEYSPDSEAFVYKFPFNTCSTGIFDMATDCRIANSSTADAPITVRIYKYNVKDWKQDWSLDSFENVSDAAIVLHSVSACVEYIREVVKNAAVMYNKYVEKQLLDEINKI